MKTYDREYTKFRAALRSDAGDYLAEVAMADNGRFKLLSGQVLVAGDYTSFSAAIGAAELAVEAADYQRAGAQPAGTTGRHMPA